MSSEAESAKPLPAATPSRVRSYAMLAVKIVVATVALTYLSRSKLLEFSTLKIFFERPGLLALDLAMWVVAGIFLTSLRWRILLTLADAHPPFLRLMRLQLIALFFNVVVPGNIGGDVLKAYYVARSEAPEKKPTILLLVLVDRLVGLAGLIGIAAVAVAMHGDVLSRDPRTKPLVFTVILLALGAFGGPVVLSLLMRLIGKPLDKLAARPGKIWALLGQLTNSVRLVSRRPLILLAAVLVSMGIHGSAFALFATFTTQINGVAPDYGALATVFPIGMLSLVLPISPAGVGVGHVAFAELFKLIGVDGGATIFNVYLVGQIAPAMLGAIPYVLEKRTLPQNPE
jgi:hypothetical protein